MAQYVLFVVGGLVVLFGLMAFFARKRKAPAAKSWYEEIHNPLRGWIGYATNRRLSDQEKILIAEHGFRGLMPPGTRFIAIYDRPLADRIGQ